jgi:hypothetical protein
MVFLTQVRFCVGLFTLSALFSLTAFPCSQAIATNPKSWLSYSKMNVDVFDLYWSSVEDVEIPEDSDTIRTVIDELESAPLENDTDDLSRSEVQPPPTLPTTD